SVHGTVTHWGGWSDLAAVSTWHSHSLGWRVGPCSSQVSTWHSHSMWWRGFLQQSGQYMAQSHTEVKGWTM
ncbi:hypothetical protein NDU88_007590, partial [Pleurodeles waltl]